MEPLCLISLNKSIHCFTPKGCSRKEEKPCDQHRLQKRNVRFVVRLVSPLMSAILTLSAPSLVAPPVSFSQPVSDGRALFQKACIGCHDMGGNILQPGATLFMKDLERYTSHCSSDNIFQIKDRLRLKDKTGVRFQAGMVLPRRRVFSTSHTMGREECRVLERNALQRVNAHLDPGCRRMRSSCWQNLLSHKLTEDGQISKAMEIDSCRRQNVQMQLLLAAR